jgi:hypothetical protein
MNMATIQPLSYSGYRFPAAIISHRTWLYFPVTRTRPAIPFSLRVVASFFLPSRHLLAAKNYREIMRRRALAAAGLKAT